MGPIAVIDTETNWDNRLMSVGLVAADEDDFAVMDTRYFVLDPEYTVGGMFDSVLFLPEQEAAVLSRHEALQEIRAWLTQWEIRALYAYNAAFDVGQLPELGSWRWYDIMGLAAYRQYNDAIPPCADCYRTGRLKRGFGVENMLRLLADDPNYYEKHNALCDALDELSIMRLLGHPLEDYARTRILPR